MDADRRIVKVCRAVFEALDRELGVDRGPDGEPSADDFLVVDLLPMVEVFARRFDELPEHIPGRPDYRVLISAGLLARAVAVVGQLNPDDTNELVIIRIEL